MTGELDLMGQSFDLKSVYKLSRSRSSLLLGTRPTKAGCSSTEYMHSFYGHGEVWFS